MPEEFKPGCQRPAVKKQQQEPGTEVKVKEPVKEEQQIMIKVGKPAPTFSAPAFYGGKFVNIDLSEFKGKWVLLCFYPGDFTFV